MSNVFRKEFRLTRADMNKLRELSEISGLTESAVIRSLIHETKLQPRPPGEYPWILYELNAIGNNVNQIAHNVNARKNTQQRDIDNCIRLLGEAYDLLDKQLFGSDDNGKSYRDKDDADTC
jgi:hypothetical protein